ncbi:MAG TPA: ABC transporter ATP-binding protein [Gaiellales bacterium]|jgi:peptide/nickel transport system ATP-binding protein
MAAETVPLLDVRSLTVERRTGWRRPVVRAVDDVSIQVHAGETVGVVGESGAGKTTIGATVLGLVRPSAGEVRFAGEDITSADGGRRRALSAEMQMIFQDPYSSLNPARTIGQTLAEPLLVHRRLGRGELADSIGAMLTRVGLTPAAADRYPAQFSGGQRQRVAIARALMIAPRLVICDEPVSALDLSVQAQVLNLLRELQAELSQTYLFISHDLAVVRHVSHRIVVLYHGAVMESGPAQLVYGSPGHPYTQALLAAAPAPDPALQGVRRAARVRRAAGGSEARWNGVGCRFAPRCPLALDVCRETAPALEPGPAGTLVACHRRDEAVAGA